MTPAELRKAYFEHVKHEPPVSAGTCPSDAAHEVVASLWASWERTRQAYLVLLADRLVEDYLKADRG